MLLIATSPRRSVSVLLIVGVACLLGISSPARATDVKVLFTATINNVYNDYALLDSNVFVVNREVTGYFLLDPDLLPVLSTSNTSDYNLGGSPHGITFSVSNTLFAPKSNSQTGVSITTDHPVYHEHTFSAATQGISNGRFETAELLLRDSSGTAFSSPTLSSVPFIFNRWSNLAFSYDVEFTTPFDEVQNARVQASVTSLQIEAAPIPEASTIISFGGLIMGGTIGLLRQRRKR